MAALSYHPSESHALHFWEKEKGNEAIDVGVPDGFPEHLDSPLAWTKGEVEAKRSDWVLELEPDDVKTLEAALASFETSHSYNLSRISPETFPLPGALAGRLKQISDQCYHGIGFKVVHGLNPSRYTDEQNVAIYAGIAAHIAPQHGFLDKNHEKVLCHVVNAAGASFDHKKSPGFTNSALSFHSDNCEILSLYALNIAPTGGRTLVSSSWQLYNDLAARRPEVLHTLADNWVLDTFKDYSQNPPLTTPFLHPLPPDSALLRFSRYPLTGFGNRQRHPSLPPPTSAQVTAIDAVQFMAARNAIPLPMEKGDIVFINDMALLHARESFDEEGGYLTRHLLKFYLRDPEQGQLVPEGAREAWERVYGANMEDGGRREVWCPRYETGTENDWNTNG